VPLETRMEEIPGQTRNLEPSEKNKVNRKWKAGSHLTSKRLGGSISGTVDSGKTRRKLMGEKYNEAINKIHFNQQTKTI
jgi:hypothetical protein